MKFWILSIITVGGCAGLLTWVIRQKVIPGFLDNANAEMVADWHAGLMDRFRETGTWPDQSDPKRFIDDMFLVVGPDGKRIPGGYMHGRESNLNMVDIYDHPLKFTFSADSCQVTSAGPDGAFGTADDVSSDKVRERYFNETLQEARTALEARPVRKKQ